MFEKFTFPRPTKRVDLTAWYFPALHDTLGVILQDRFIKDVLKEMSEVIDEAIRKDSDISLWDNGKPTIMVSIPLTKESGDGGIVAWINVLELVKGYIEDCDEEDTLADFGKKFERYSKMFHAASKKVQAERIRKENEAQSAATDCSD